MRVIHSRSTDMKDLSTGRGFADPARKSLKVHSVERRRYQGLLNALTTLSFQLGTWVFAAIAYACGLAVGFLASNL